jgi:hypothetical protein
MLPHQHRLLHHNKPAYAPAPHPHRTRTRTRTSPASAPTERTRFLFWQPVSRNCTVATGKRSPNCNLILGGDGCNGYNNVRLVNIRS